MSMAIIPRILAAGAVSLVTLGSATASPLVINKEVILAQHNKYRAEVGVPLLTWSEKLAVGAQRWATYIAALNQMKHSGTAGVGENLAIGRGVGATLPTMIGIWEREKPLFKAGTFPNVSRDGNWQSVGHYTQMVWRTTTEVGCGLGNNTTTDFLVCWYSPRGNMAGSAVY